MDIFNYRRRKSSVVRIGDTPLGGDHPIRVQSMTNTSTLDTEGSIEQCIRIIEAGGEYVRLTAQGVREAENLRNIKNELRAKNYQTPLVADIHFNPKAADAAARIVEKVRINPGNFVDSAKTFQAVEYTDDQYKEEIEKIRRRFIPFLNICNEHKTAIRIGVNHGSLSDRIMSRFGDTPTGMVESCMEYLRICRDELFYNVVISIKASNTSIMIRTVRLLVKKMEEEKMFFPLHLGVTEAGDGEDGRIKSSVGIGTLLSEGIGDTIRVSLSEDPELEIPVAKLLVNYVTEKSNHPVIEGIVHNEYKPFDPERRNTNPVDKIGGNQVPVVISDRSMANDNLSSSHQFIPDYLYIGSKNPADFSDFQRLIVDYSNFSPKKNISPLVKKEDLEQLKENFDGAVFLQLTYPDLDENVLSYLNSNTHTVIVLKTNHINNIGEQKAFVHKLMNEGIKSPVIFHQQYKESEASSLQIKSGTDFGPFLIDMQADGILLCNEGNIPTTTLDACAFGILQACGRRTSKTEYISCPSCGRTLFDLQSTIKKVREATSHLKELKIGIMGCIVNGPGEMADADYGYVGAGFKIISLYKGKECVEKNIPEEKAVERLIELIKKQGDWKEI